LEAKKNGWRFYSLIIEVGARGWVPNSVAPALRKLGLSGVNAFCKKLSFIALKSSYIIWLNRFNREFQPWRLGDYSSNSGIVNPSVSFSLEPAVETPTVEKKLLAYPVAMRQDLTVAANPTVEKKLLANPAVAMRQDLTVADDPSVAMRQASASESIYKKQKKSPSSSYAQRRSALNSKLASSPTRPAAPEGVQYTAPHNRRWLPADEKQKPKDSRVVQIIASFAS